MLQAVDDALDGLVGANECVVVAGIGNDDVGFRGLRRCFDELMFQCVKTYTELGLKRRCLVLNADDGLVVASFKSGIGDTGLCHQQDDTGTLGCSFGTLDTKVFYLIVSMANTCSINKTEGDAIQQHRVFDGVASGTLNITYDGSFLAEQSIEQGALAYVWSSNNGHWDAIFEGIASLEGFG